MLLKELHEDFSTNDCNMDESHIYSGNRLASEIPTTALRNLTLTSESSNTLLSVAGADVANEVVSFGNIETVQESDLRCVQKASICGTEDCAAMSSVQKQPGSQMNYDFSDQELLLNIHLLKGCGKIRNEITPPPGAPKLENSARLRRYRHNVD